MVLSKKEKTKEATTEHNSNDLGPPILLVVLIPDIAELHLLFGLQLQQSTILRVLSKNKCKEQF